MKRIALFLGMTALLAAETLPSPSHILLVQEREARARRMQARVRQVETPAAPVSSEFTAADRAQLEDAIRRFLATQQPSRSRSLVASLAGLNGGI
jgi:hypothetical protein